MGSQVSKLLGMGSNKALAAAQEKQRAQLEASERANKALLDGQRRAASGGQGFLSYLDDQLKGTFGG